MVEVDELFKELKVLREKASRFDNLKSRYVDYARRVRDLMEKQAAIQSEWRALVDGVDSRQKELLKEFQALAGEIDPVASSSEPRKRKRMGEDVRVMRDEVYEKVQAGSEFSRDLIVKAYGISASEAYGVFCKVRGMPNVGCRTSHKVKFLYCLKEMR